MSGMLYQIEAKQAQRQAAYAATIKAKKPLPLPVEKTIAVALPISLHARADKLMASTGFTNSKKEFFYNVLNAAFDVLALKQ